ncbi:MAG: hypothetical protein ACRC7C_14405 [Beijerinckiaceae bacterium]
MVQSLPSRPKIMGGSFRLQRVQAANPSRGGTFQGVDLAEALWAAQIDTTPLSRAQAGEYDAFFSGLRGILRTAYVWDAKRPRPIAYHSAATATNARIGVTTRRIGLTSLRIARAVYGWGSPWVAAISRAASTLSLTGCRAGATFLPGDYIAWDDKNARRLHIVQAAATADASGAVTLTVEPQPPATAAVTFPVPAILEKASAEMVVVQHQMPWTVAGLPSASFQAVQVLRSNA